MVEEKHVLDILTHIRALQVKRIQILKRGCHHIGIHFHEKRDSALGANVVGEKPRLCLRK